MTTANANMRNFPGSLVASAQSAIVSARTAGAPGGDLDEIIRWLWEGGRGDALLCDAEDVMARAWRRLFGGAVELPCGARIAARGGMPPGRMVDDAGRVVCVARGSIRLGVLSESPADVLPRVVISGGQTGADRGALDAGIDAGVPIGGWAPAGWRADGGAVPDRFRACMSEHSSSGYEGRTLQNILDGDATLIVSFGPISGGSRATLTQAILRGKMIAQLVLGSEYGGENRGLWFRGGEAVGALADPADVVILDWIREHDIGVLNVAGPRERKEPGIGSAVRELMGKVLRASRRGATSATSKTARCREDRDEVDGDALPPVAPDLSAARLEEDRDQAADQVGEVDDDVGGDDDEDRRVVALPARSARAGMSRDQGRAALGVSNWMRDPRAPQVHRLFGYAGTGKTTIARELVAESGRPWLFASYTGKAALVMRQRGCHGAQTIHSLIYRPEGDSPGGPSFRLWEESPLLESAGLVIDECSMVDEELGRDLLSFKKKILVLGDPAQLPPIVGGGFFTSGAPDFLLTEVFRQAADSGILDLATFVREGGDLAGRIGWSSEDCAVIRRSRDAGAEIMARMVAADQVIVGLNRTRHAFNDRYRRASGVDGKMPAAGDKVVCLRNERRRGLFNGSMWRVESAVASPTGRFVDFGLSTLDGISPGRIETRSWAHHFLGRELELESEGPARRAHQEFDYGYYLTCHKAQGSQWDDVVLYDESGSFDRDTARRWLYTGITRAARRLLVVA